MVSKKQVAALAVVALVIAVSGCAEPQPQTIEVTREVAVPETVEVTRQVTEVVKAVVTQEVEVTRLVTAEPTPTPTAAVSAQDVFAANHIASQEQGSVTMELVRVACTTRSAFEDWSSATEEEINTWYGDSTAVCEFILKVENKADTSRSVYPRSRHCRDWQRAGGLDGPVYVDQRHGRRIWRAAARSSAYWGFWFGVRRSEIDQIDRITYIVDAPTDEDYGTRGGNFRFEFSTEGWGDEPFPEDL